MTNLLSAAAHLDNLYRAWRDVRRQVRHSAWPQLIAELSDIDAAPLAVLRKIHAQLIDRTYRFSPKWAYAKQKSGGSRRGITVQGIRDRIVQRAILNIFFSTDSSIQMSLGNIPRILNAPTSFAGLPDRGVPEAIGLVQSTIRNGAIAFAYSDMKDFFPCVPRQDVVDLLASQIHDADFLALIRDALETELLNPDAVRAWLDLFPIAELGVAQGSLLSTLVGNLCLGQFDARMNDDQIVTVRYLDDFLILAPSLPQAKSAFERAQQELAQLKMNCYVPEDGSHKAAWGLIRDGFQFLGCQIHPDGISPARSTCKKLIAAISQMIATGKKVIQRFEADQQRRRAESAYVQTLVQIDRKIRGWGDVYRFVSNRVRFAQLDSEIDQLLAQFHGWFQRHSQGCSKRSLRRMQGIALLSDTPRDPRFD